MRRIVVMIAAVAPFLTGCRPDAPAPGWSDASPHTEGFVRTASGPLHYLDWGGSGPDLILIHGLGDNPHVYDGLARRLNGPFRVVAYARRGHGRSTKAGPFDTPTLVADLVAVMDSLGIGTAHLVGWSMGGNEITAMAGSHPERVRRIVYLDAGYDWADPGFAASLSEAPFSLTPPAEAWVSLDAFRAWQRAVWFPGVTDMAALEAYIRGLVDVQPDGSVRPVAAETVTNGLFEALLTNRRDYMAVRAPALALYTTTFFDVTAGDSAQQARTLAWEVKHMRPFRAASMARLLGEIAGSDTLTVPGTHADFVFNAEEEVATAIISFLDPR